MPVDGDGVQDGFPSEPGLPNVDVVLTWYGFDGKPGTAVDVIYTATTDALGNYQFKNLAPGSYEVTIDPLTLPANVTPTFDLNGPLDGSATRLLIGGESATDVDFGYRGTASVGDNVWYDVDGNGMQNNYDPGIAGATVVVTWAGVDGKLGTPDDVTFGTTTDANGKFLFQGLPVYGPADLYRVTVATPPQFTTPTFDADGIATPNQSTLTLAPGATNLLQDFGYRGNSLIGDRVFEGLNANGIQGLAEPGINGVTVTLLDGTGSKILATATTAGGGLYSFPNLISGQYVLQFTPPAGFVVTTPDLGGNDTLDSDANSATGKTAIITLSNNETNTTVDAGIFRPTSGGDFVSFDIDGDGLQDPGEPGIPNAKVTIIWLGPDGKPGGGDDKTFTTTTDANGKYTINNLPPGNYTVSVGSLPNGLTIPKFGMNSFPLNSGMNRTDIDFGFKGVGMTGDLVWFDVNRDGLNSVEPGISNVTVQAVWAGFDGKPGTADDLTFTTKTSATGLYGFSGLPIGSYQVKVDTATLPAGLSPTYDFDNGLVNPNNSTAITLTAGTPTETRSDFGYTSGGSIGDRIWLDFDGDGIQDIGEPGLTGIIVTLTWAGPDNNLATPGDNVVLTTTTSPNGQYSFANLPPGNYDVKVTGGLPASLSNTGDPDGIKNGQTSFALGINQAKTDIDFGYQGGSSLSGFVYRDFSVDGIRQLAGVNPETGIGNVTVVLTGTDINNNKILQTTVTAADGSYLFFGLLAGDYTITQTQPPSVFKAGVNGFFNGLSSSGKISGIFKGTSPTIDQLSVSLSSSEDGVEYNFGENPPADPFGFVYIDLNNNGIREPDEPGIPGVAVTISGTAFAGTKLARPLTTADTPGKLTAITDANGKWEFPIVPPGNLSFTETQPAGYADGKEQDGDPNGPPVTIGNDVFSNVVLQPFPIRGPFNFGELAGNGSLSGSVYLDFKLNGTRDPGELGLPGVTVTLTGTDLTGQTVTSKVVTDINGTFTFLRLRPGNYSLTHTQPVGPNIVDGLDSAGNLGGTAGNDVIFNIVVGTNALGFRYQFGERLVGIAKEQFLASSASTTQLTGTPGTGISSVNAPTPAGQPLQDGNGNQLFATGADAGGGPHVRVFSASTGAEAFSFFAFAPTFTGGVRVATADVTGDGFDDVIVAAGPGGGPHVKVIDGVTHAVERSFFAFAAAFTGGVHVAGGDVNNDGFDNIIVGADAGGGPHVKVICGKDGSTLSSFFAFGAAFAGGVRVAAGDVNGDGFADVVAGAGAGGGPHVRVFDRGTANQLMSFFAFDAALTGGIYVAAGDTDGDGRADVIVSNGSGPQTRIFSGGSGALLNALATFGGGFTSGIRVGVVDTNNDGVDEIITGAGPNGGPHVRVLNALNGTQRHSFFAYDPTFLGGVYVG